MAYKYLPYKAITTGFKKIHLKTKPLRLFM